MNDFAYRCVDVSGKHVGGVVSAADPQEARFTLKERGLLVTGVDVSSFCKLCRECIEVCPEKLFVAAPFQEVWEEASTS